MGNNQSTQTDNEYMATFHKEVLNGGIRVTCKGVDSTSFLNQSSIPVYFKWMTATTFIPSSTRELFILHPGCTLTVPRKEYNTFILAPVVTFPFKGQSLHQTMHFGTIRVPPGEGEL